MKMLAVMSAVGIHDILNVPSSIFSRMKWYRMSMCLDPEELVSELASLIAL